MFSLVFKGLFYCLRGWRVLSGGTLGVGLCRPISGAGDDASKLLAPCGDIGDDGRG